MTLALSMASCRTVRENISLRDSIVVIHDTVFTARLQYDSTSRDHYHSVIAVDSVIFIHDSVVHYRLRTKHDSIYINKTDTVFVKRNVVKTREVPRKRTWFDYISYAALGILAIMLVRKARLIDVRC